MDKVKLGEICEAIIDCPHSTPEWTNEGVIVIRNFNLEDTVISIDEPFYVSEEAYKERTRRGIPAPGDIIISREAPIGRVGLIPEGLKCCLGQRLVLLKPDYSKVSSQYLLMVLTSNYARQQYEKANSLGSIVSNLSLPQLRNLEIPIIDDSESVASFMTNIGRKIAVNKRLIKELSQTARLIYDYWFTQFDFPDENGKPYRSSGGNMVWSDELKREIPEGWEVGTVADLISGVRTGLNPRNNFKLTDSGWAYLTVKNLTATGEIDFSSCDFIDDEAREIAHKRSDVSEGDVLFASISPLGRCYLVQSDPDDWEINESIFSIRPNNEVISSEFLYMFFTSLWFVKAAEGSTAGSVFKGIRHEELRAIRTFIPKFSIVQAFTDKVSTLLKTMNHLSDENKELVSLRDWLLPMLMNGQVKVS